MKHRLADYTADSGNQNVDKHALIGQEGRADVTLGSGHTGLMFSLKLTDPQNGTTRTAYLNDQTALGREPVESIRIQLTALKDHGAMILEARRRPADGAFRSDQWDIEIMRDGEVKTAEHQSFTNIPFGACHVVAIDVVRRELPARLVARAGNAGAGKAL